MSGPHTELPHLGPPTWYAVRSPCCDRRVLVEEWELRYGENFNDGSVLLRCGSVLDTPGWGRTANPGGCGETFTMAVDDARRTPATI